MFAIRFPAVTGSSAVVRRHQEPAADQADPEQQVPVLGVGARAAGQVVERRSRAARTASSVVSATGTHSLLAARFFGGGGV